VKTRKVVIIGGVMPLGVKAARRESAQATSGREEIVAVSKVLTVDLVSDPATGCGLWESATLAETDRLLGVEEVREVDPEYPAVVEGDPSEESDPDYLAVADPEVPEADPRGQEYA
jgi:hypothetical protein